MLVPAIAFALVNGPKPPFVVYPTTDFARLPISAATPTVPAAPVSCVSVKRVNNVPQLVDQPCGTLASTFRVIGRVGSVSQCVRDADLTYSWASGQTSGAVCLDYDWAADQCLQIISAGASKVHCSERGALRPDEAIIGAVDVTYCRDGGIAHPLRRFTVCTLAGKSNRERTTRGT